MSESDEKNPKMRLRNVFRSSQEPSNDDGQVAAVNQVERRYLAQFIDLLEKSEKAIKSIGSMPLEYGDMIWRIRKYFQDILDGKDPAKSDPRLHRFFLQS